MQSGDHERRQHTAGGGHEEGERFQHSCEILLLFLLKRFFFFHISDGPNTSRDFLESIYVNCRTNGKSPTKDLDFNEHQGLSLFFLNILLKSDTIRQK